MRLVSSDLLDISKRNACVVCLTVSLKITPPEICDFEASKGQVQKKGEIVKIPLLGSDRTNYGNVAMLLQLCSKDSMAWLSKTAAQKGNRI